MAIEICGMQVKGREGILPGWTHDEHFLHIAAYFGKEEMVRMILERMKQSRKSDWPPKTTRGGPLDPVYFAIFGNQPNTLRYLLPLLFIGTLLFLISYCSFSLF